MEILKMNIFSKKNLVKEDLELYIKLKID